MSGKLMTVFGGQFGSEGKGEVTALLAKKCRNTVAGVRIGGPNAGHTSYSHGVKIVVQSLPTPSAVMGCDAYIGPEGCFIPELLKKEVEDFFIRAGKHLNLYIDSNATVVTPEHMTRESELKGKIGSTGEGVGAATADKVMRLPVTAISYADELKELFAPIKPLDLYIGHHITNINDAFKNEKYWIGATAVNYFTVIIEGTQGYGLGLHTGGYYPFCTSRECTPFALWSGTGINPNLAKSEVHMVIRTYPIRVGGNSGPLKNEITWERLERLTNGYVKTPEITTVTKKIRRIGEMDNELIQRAVDQTSPDYLDLTFLDYKFPHVAGKSWSDIKYDTDVLKYIKRIEDLFGVPVGVISTGPGTASFTKHLEKTYENI